MGVDPVGMGGYTPPPPNILGGGMACLFIYLFLLIYFHTWVGSPFSKADFQMGPIKNM